MHAYLDLLREAIDEPAHDRAEGRILLFGQDFCHDMRKGFPLTRPVSFHDVFHEVKWAILGVTNASWLQQRGVRTLDKYADEAVTSQYGRHDGYLGPVHGQLLRGFGSVDVEAGYDQLKALIDSVRRDPYGHGHVITFWNPEDHAELDLVPASPYWQFRCHDDGGLSLHVTCRVADLIREVPQKIARAGLVLSLVAHMVARHPRLLRITFVDSYLREEDLTLAEQLVERQPHAPPQLTIHDRFRGRGINGLDEVRWEDVILSNYEPHLESVKV